MSSGYPIGNPDLYTAATRAAGISNNAAGGYNGGLGQQQQFQFQSAAGQDAGEQIRRPEFMGKRSLFEMQQDQQALGFYLRNLRMRPHYQHGSPVSPLSLGDLSAVSPEFWNPRYGIPVMRRQRPQELTGLNGNFAVAAAGVSSPAKGFGGSSEISGREEAEKSLMNHRLQELEKELLRDEDDDEAVSVVTNNEFSEAIRSLIGPAQKPISPSPTSSSSSCASTSASQPCPCPKQSLIDAAIAISEGKPDSAAEIIARLLQEANARGTSKQKLTTYMVSALKSRVTPPTGGPPVVAEVCTEEHAVSTQMLYCVSPCFKLGFMAANLAILEAAAELCLEKIHVLDFELGQGGQYVHLLHTLAAKTKPDSKSASSLTITAFPYSGGEEEKLKTVGEGLKVLAQKIGISLTFHVRDLNIATLSVEKLEIHPDEVLAVNFAFKLQKLPDESVTVENFRDELLRRVKTLSPAVVTVVEQELNTNTAPLITRVRDAYDYYSALLESLDHTFSSETPDRARIDDAIGRKIANAIACEGRGRVDRCEVFGKWRSRMSMAGFLPFSLSPRAAESLRAKLNTGTRVNPGFTVGEESGGISFGWRGKTLTLASGWRGN